MKIIISGITGLIGKSLAMHLLKLNYDVIGLSRNPSKVDFLPKDKVFNWNTTGLLDSSILSSADGVVHLAGESVAGFRWTKEKKNKIIKSRVESTKNLVASIERIEVHLRPKFVICASAIGYYGDFGEENIDELSKAKKIDFLSTVTENWEDELLPLDKLGIRNVKLRTGIVLAKDGGALEQMKPVILGDGNQWMSWIHLEDEIRFIEFSITNNISGAFNCVSPQPIRNRDFTKTLAKYLKVKFVFSVPKIIIKTILGEFAEVVFSSQKVFPKRTLAAGFKFHYENIESAFDQIFLSSVVIEETSSRST